MAGAVRTVNAEVNLKGNANQELGKVNQNLDKTEKGFTSLTDQLEQTANAQSMGAQTMNLWSQAFMAAAGMSVADTFLEIAGGALAFAWSADEASLSTTGWIRTVQEFIAEYLAPLIEFVRELVDGFKDLKEWLFGTDEGMRLIYATLVALSPLIAFFLVYGIWLVIKATYAWVAANWALIVSYAPLVLMWLGIAAAVAAVVLVVEDFITWMQGGESYFGDWLGEWKGFGQAFSDIWSKSTTWIKNRSSDVWEWTKNAASKSWNWMKGLFNGDKGSFSDIFWSIAGSIGNAFSTAWNWITGLFTGGGSSIKGTLGSWVGWLRNAVGTAWDWVKDKFWNFSDFLANEFPRVGKFINSFLVTPLNFVLGIVQKVLNFLGMFSGKFSDMASGLGAARDEFSKFGLKRGLEENQAGPTSPDMANASYQPQLNFDGKRAGGGDVDPYGTYLVGEKGPEVLQMGGRGGTVIPNNALGGRGGNVYQIGPIYVTATSEGAGQSLKAQLKRSLDELFAVEYAAEAGMA